MSKQTPKREYFDLVTYENNTRKTIGVAYKTEKGSIHLKADSLLDAGKLGRLLKKGLYIQKQFKGKNRSFKPKTSGVETTYKSAADEYDKKFNSAA